MRRNGALLLGGIGLVVSAGVLTASRLGDSRPASLPATPSPAVEVSEADRSLAWGLLLDSAPAPSSVDRGLAVAESLRKKYGIDTGDAARDRAEAAARAQREVLDPLVLDEKQVADMATKLGYSLDPSRCANTCENVRELAILELKKSALEAFAAN